MRRLVPLLILLAYTACSGSEFVRHPYVQNVSETAVTILWETRKPASGTLFVGKTQVRFAEARVQEIRVEGLKPDTLHDFKIDDITYGSFKTFPRGRRHPVHFIVYGDNRSDPVVHGELTAMMLKKAPLFVLNSGDLVSNGGDTELWHLNFFAPIRDLARNVPLFTALGNHELDSALYFNFLSLPNNERFYSFDAGCVHVVVLDSNVRDPAGIKAQADWLEKDLASDDAPWTIALFHHSPLSFRAAGLSLTIIDRYLPAMIRHGVDFVFSGHDHQYHRYVAMKHVRNALTCIVSAGGGAPLHKARPTPWSAKATSCHHFCEVHAERDAIRIDAIDRQGEVFDRLERKGPATDAYLAKAEPLARVLEDMRAKLPDTFLEDKDELLDSLRIELDGKPQAGKGLKGRLTVVYNPFQKPLGFKVDWVTKGTSWSVTPDSASVEVPPQSGRAMEFTFRVGRIGEPKPVANFRFSYGEKTGEGTLELDKKGKPKAYK